MALAYALRVETHAPAAAPDPVVSLHQTGKVVPGVRAERPRHIGPDRCHRPIMASSSLARARQGRSARRDQQAVKLEGLSPAGQVDLFGSKCVELGSWC